MDLRTIKSVTERRKVVENNLGVSLSNIGKYSLDEFVASTRNCENMIGATQIPLGVAGPLILRTTNSEPQTYCLPLATTEGALVASVNRGCRAIFESGGATVESYRLGATRGPVFKVKSLKQNCELYEFLARHESEIKKIAETTSSHLKYKSFTTKSVGHYRYVRFSFDTQDAMGLNMVTIATDAVCKYITQNISVELISLSGNYCTDKKPAWVNFEYGRGIEVWAEAVIPAKIVKTILKTSADKVVQTWLAKCMIGSAMSGSMGYNAQYANILSAIFIATGQDPAHVAECAIGVTTTEVEPGGENGHDLYISIYLPDLMVGTVGGGTGLATQKEALSIMGVAGGNNGLNSEKYAGIIGGAVLAGELSLLASLSEGTLAQAHQRLGRGK
jgi:hydroxymethylglutaryl-CoA reductase (NADPH)